MEQVKKSFDISKHKHFSNLKDYLKEITENKYYYTIEDIANILDAKEQYIQINYIDKLDTLYIDNTNKKNLRGIIRCIKFDKVTALADEEIKDLYKYIEKFIVHEDLLRKRILVSENSIHNLILGIFKKEVFALDENGKRTKDIDNNYVTKLEKLSIEDLDIILKSNLYSTTSLKQKKKFNHDTQLYRYLKTKKHIKLVCEDSSNKANRVRYILR